MFVLYYCFYVPMRPILRRYFADYEDVPRQETTPNKEMTRFSFYTCKIFTFGTDKSIKLAYKKKKKTRGNIQNLLATPRGSPVPSSRNLRLNRENL